MWIRLAATLGRVGVATFLATTRESSGCVPRGRRLHARG